LYCYKYLILEHVQWYCTLLYCFSKYLVAILLYQVPISKTCSVSLCYNECCCVVAKPNMLTLSVILCYKQYSSLVASTCQSWAIAHSHTHSLFWKERPKERSHNRSFETSKWAKMCEKVGISESHFFRSPKRAIAHLQKVRLPNFLPENRTCSVFFFYTDYWYNNW